MTEDVSNDDTLRGSTPIYTAKDVLVQVDSKIDTIGGKVDELSKSVAIIISQDLGKRVSDIESWQNRVIGVAATSRVLGLIGTLLGIIAIGWQIADRLT